MASLEVMCQKITIDNWHKVYTHNINVSNFKFTMEMKVFFIVNNMHYAIHRIRIRYILIFIIPIKSQTLIPNI